LVSDIKGEHGLRVFENRVQRRMCGPRKDEVTEGWRKLPSIIRMVKSRRMQWAALVA
jgi:hypothetical protein